MKELKNGIHFSNITTKKFIKKKEIETTKYHYYYFMTEYMVLLTIKLSLGRYFI